MARAEGEPGEGQRSIDTLPLTRLGPAVLGTLSPLSGAREGKRFDYAFSQTPSSWAPRLWLGDIFQPISVLWDGTMRCHHNSGC